MKCGKMMCSVKNIKINEIPDTLMAFMEFMELQFLGGL